VWNLWGEDRELGLPIFFGGAKGDRTPDLLNAIQALSQLSYSPGKMERVTRFELATYALARRRSTAELNPQTKLVGRGGFEPPKHGVRLIYSQFPLATWVSPRVMVAQARVELATRGFSVRCSTN
jgi:hypothetical protein